MKYNRYINDSNVVESLKNEKLFDKLNMDFIKAPKKESVFPAIRDNAVHFYYKGSRPFIYESEKFKTHFKYISIPTNKDYVSSGELNDQKLNIDFTTLYEEIKKTASKYAGVESLGISSLYSKYSYINKNKGVVVLDVEFRFNEKDRVDLVLFNLDTKILLFVEAKHFSNPELWNSKDGCRKVVNQVKKYNDAIGDGVDIIENYTKCIKTIKDIFNIELPKPEKCILDCGLYIFGFDGSQKDGRLQDSLLGNGALEEIKYYALGNPKDINIDTLWDKLTKNQ